MESELVGLRLNAKILAEARKAATLDGYKNVQEFMRDILRQAIAERRLHQLAGSRPGIGRVTRELRDELAKKHYL